MRQGSYNVAVVGGARVNWRWVHGCMGRRTASFTVHGALRPGSTSHIVDELHEGPHGMAST
jgi:hypothetical protein